MAQRISELKVLICGGGEMASGITHRLRCCHMNIIITEIEAPTAVRRTVAFAEAVYDGAQTIERVTARRASSLAEIKTAWQGGEVPVIVDAGEIVGTVEDTTIPAGIAGLIRGMLRSGVRVRAGMKIGDIDPRLERGYCYQICDKSRASAAASWNRSSAHLLI